jgi:sugar transferase (PEP-CTERM/EpsH1 system associated)
MDEVLFLSHRLPYPPNKGEKIRAWHFLEYLTRSFTVHLGSFTGKAESPEHLALLRDCCGETHFEPIDESPVQWRNLIAFAKGEPITLRHFHRAGMQRWVKGLLHHRRPKAILAYSGAMVQFVPREPLPGCRRVIDFVDVDSEKWAQYAARAFWPHRWIYGREARLLSDFEQKTALDFDASVFVSDHESALFRVRVPQAAEKVVTIGNGVDGEVFRPGQNYTRPDVLNDQSAVFIGAMDYRPNIDGAVWFAHEVVPKVRRLRPDFRFVIVGSNPSPDILRLQALPGVFVTGGVERVQPYLEHAGAVVVPLRLSQGVPNKILEALAMAKAVVTTPIALRGLQHVRPGLDLSTAEDAEAFAKAVIALLESPVQARDIGEHARSTVLTNYTWQRSHERLARLLRNGPRPLTTADQTDA